MCKSYPIDLRCFASSVHNLHGMSMMLPAGSIVFVSRHNTEHRRSIIHHHDSLRDLFHPRSLPVINMELFQQRCRPVETWFSPRTAHISQNSRSAHTDHTEQRDVTTAHKIMQRVMFAGICRSIEIAGGDTGLTSLGTLNTAFEGGRGLRMRCDVGGSSSMKDVFMHDSQSQLLDGMKLFLILVRRDRILTGKSPCDTELDGEFARDIPTSTDKGSPDWQASMMNKNQGKAIDDLREQMGVMYKPDNYWRFEPFATFDIVYDNPSYSKPTVQPHVINASDWQGACMYIGTINQSPNGTAQQCNRLRGALQTMLFANADDCSEVGDVISTHTKLCDMVVNIRNNMGCI
jgi:hypothetical protein